MSPHTRQRRISAAAARARGALRSVRGCPNPKPETRDPKETRNPRSEGNSLLSKRAVLLGNMLVSGFGLRISFGFLYFGVRISRAFRAALSPPRGTGLAFGRPSAIVRWVESRSANGHQALSRQRRFLRLLLVAGLLSCLPGKGRAAEPLPPASEVTRRMIERAQTVAESEQGPQYTYEKRSVLERLDAAGRVIRVGREDLPGDD